jgi:hypothetical protein
VTDLALLDELGHRADGLLDRDLGIHAVLVVEVDPVGPETLKRSLDRRAHVLGRAVERADCGELAGPRGVHPARELGRDHVLVAVALDRPPDEFLVAQRAIQLRGVEKVDPQLERALDRRDCLRFVGGPVESRHAHAAKPECRHLEVGKFAPLHRCPSLSRSRSI